MTVRNSSLNIVRAKRRRVSGPGLRNYPLAYRRGYLRRRKQIGFEMFCRYGCK